MLNPLAKKQRAINSARKDEEQSKLQTKDEIFCRLCKQRYSITAYREHTFTHKRQKRPAISTYFEKDIHFSSETLANKDSLYIAHEHDLSDTTKLKRLFFTSLAEPQLRRSQQFDKNKEQGATGETSDGSLGVGKLRASELNQSLTFCDRCELPFQNPQFREVKGSIIDMLKPERGGRQCDSSTTRPWVGHPKKCASLYENLIESLSDHKISSLSKIAHEKL